MLKPLIGLTVGLTFAATSVWAAPFGAPARGQSMVSLPSLTWSIASDSEVKKSDRKKAERQARRQSEALWARLQAALLFAPQARAETPDQPAGGSAPESGANAEPKETGKPGRRTQKPADKDEAREKSGPELLPLAF